MIDKFKADLQRFMEKWGLKMSDNDEENMLFTTDNVIVSVGVAVNPFGFNSNVEDEAELKLFEQNCEDC